MRGSLFVVIAVRLTPEWRTADAEVDTARVGEGGSGGRCSFFECEAASE